MPASFRCLLLGALLLWGGVPVRAQLVASPESLAVALAPGDSAEHVVTLTNAGSDSLAFCLSFERPLQRTGGGLHLGHAAAGGACGPLGEVLYYVDEEDLDPDLAFGWDPYGLAMTPDGRLFVADFTAPWMTFELTPELEILRAFEHPTVAELTPFAATEGAAYDPAAGTLWWLNIEQQAGAFFRAMLLEGDLDGTPTGRRITIPPLTDSTGAEVRPLGLGFDPATHRFYVGASTEAPFVTTLWAVDTTGTIASGYPVEQTAYPGGVAVGPDAFGGWDPDGGPDSTGAPGEPEAVRFEMAVAPPGAALTDRFVVVDSAGRSLGLETPLPDVSGGTMFGSFTGEPLRSRVDPNGVAYFPFTNLDTEGVVGIRPHPLPPSWLALSRWDGTLGPGESVEIVLTFTSSTREIGNAYTAALQVFEAATGAAVEVPLAFAVGPPVAGEDGAGLAAQPSLEVWPNPTTRQATVAVAVPARSALRVEVFDVLGRRVAVLHDAEAPAGRHRLALPTAALPSGVYLVRAVVGTEAWTARLTLVR